MITVQQLIDRHKRGQKCQYAEILVKNEMGQLRRYSNVSNYVNRGRWVAFDYVVDMRDVFPDSTPDHYSVYTKGEVIEFVEDK